MVLVISNQPRARLIWYHSPDYSLNCSPLSPISITKCVNNKMLEYDWLLTALFYDLVGCWKVSRILLLTQLTGDRTSCRTIQGYHARNTCVNSSCALPPTPGLSTWNLSFFLMNCKFPGAGALKPSNAQWWGRKYRANAPLYIMNKIQAAAKCDNSRSCYIRVWDLVK